MVTMQLPGDTDTCHDISQSELGIAIKCDVVHKCYIQQQQQQKEKQNSYLYSLHMALCWNLK